MESLIEHVHASLLGFLGVHAAELQAETGQTFTVVNFDALFEEGALPPNHILGLEDFSYEERDDPVARVHGLFTVACYDDAQNMLLIKALSKLIKNTKPEKAFSLLNVDSATEIGEVVFYGYRSVPPKDRGEQRIFQSVLFSAGIHLDSN